MSEKTKYTMCPFCGTIIEISNSYYTYQCLGCGASGSNHNDKMIMNWKEIKYISTKIYDSEKELIENGWKGKS